MSTHVITFLKNILAHFGFFMARQFKGRATGYVLERDLRLLITKADPVCFDVGANEGQTIQLLQRCYAHPVIYAFEPASATYQSLTKQSLGNQVQVHQLALGAEEGAAVFRNYKHSDLSSFLAMHPDRAENIFADEEMVSVESVQVATLDNFCSTHNIRRIDLLKIDTQGFELPVLRGGASLFNRQQVGAVLLELNFSTLYEGQSDALEIMHFLRSQGLRLVDFYEKERMTGKELSWTTALFVRPDQSTG